MTNATKQISARARKALEILKAGGYFRTQLETKYYPVRREQFVTRLRYENGSIASGFGFQTYQELLPQLQRRDCVVTSVWPEEYKLKAE
jgi:hypothetical protein